ncbi:unnamed protein product, partial [Oppiella nova]
MVTSDDHTIDDMIHSLLNKINLGLITTNDEPLLGKMKEIQVNENHIKIKIEEIRRELKKPGRLIKLLDATGLHQEAIGMAEMFRMEEPWPYTNDMDLKVINASILRSGSSRYFLMEFQPRGRAIVFVTTDGLMDEADRWASIFKQLGFQYAVYRDATCIQIRDVLEVIRDKPFDANALFVVFIGGGYNENICGYGNRPHNEMSFTDIVDIFSDRNPTKQLETDQEIEKHIHMNYNLPRTYVIYTHSKSMDSWRNPTE